MNVIVPTKLKAAIDADERARRKQAVDYARGSVRLEGFVLSPYDEEMYSRYIEGDISRTELSAKILAHHKL